MPAHRQSALLLHGLDRADQRWILDQLDSADARILRGHLSELKSLGIPADPSLAANGSAAAGLAGALATVHGASAAQLHMLLADEPASAVAQLLAVRAWPWRQAFLDGLDPARRTRIGALPTAPLAPRAAAELVAQAAHGLAQQLAQDPLAPIERPRAPLLALRKAAGRWL